MDTTAASDARTDTGTSVTVLIPYALARLFPGAGRRIAVDAATVGGAIAALDRHWPGMADRIRDSRPAIRRHINVFVDGHRADLDTPLPQGAEMAIMTAISGG